MPRVADLRKKPVASVASSCAGRRFQLGLTIAFVATLWLASPAVPAFAQTALTVGSVRDQTGAAIPDAEVEGYDARGAQTQSVRTDGAGTFAMPGEGVVRVAVRCRFCRTTSAGLVPGQVAVVIVRRFQALLTDAPSPSDLQNVPYSRVESAIALRPFALLRQSTTVTSGSQLSALGFQPAQALLVDSGVPNYDVIGGTSPYDAIPANDVRVANIAAPAEAFLYGDRAGSGTISVEPFGDANDSVGLIGGATSIRVQGGSPQAGAVLTASNDAADWRQRFDARFQTQLAASQTLGVDVATSQYRETGVSSDALDGSYSFAHAAYNDAQPGYDVGVDLTTDRGVYSASGLRPVSDFEAAYDGVWSDTGFAAGIRTHGSVFFFADTGVRLSSGGYDTQGFAYDASGNIVQRRLDVGFEADEPDYTLRAGVGQFGIDYQGGGWGSSGGQRTALATPSLQLQLFPNARWGASFSASGSFSLPTIVEQYDGYPYSSLDFDRASSYTGTLSYTDLQRVRIDVEAASQHVAGSVNGLVTSAGLSVTWQFAPALSLRAWTMRVDDATTPALPASYTPYPYPYPSTFGDATVNAFWLTYENPGAIRFDAIYRRDLLNGQPFEHVDGDVSGPIKDGLRWYAGVQDVARTTYLSAGLRFNP